MSTASQRDATNRLFPDEVLCPGYVRFERDAPSSAVAILRYLSDLLVTVRRLPRSLQYSAIERTNKSTKWIQKLAIQEQEKR